jgi:hypothetical protein
MTSGRRRVVAIAVAIGAAMAATTAASASVAGAADDATDTFRIELSGYQETPLTLSTSFRGSFRIQIDERKQEIKYRLSYGELEPDTAVVNQAHIHIGQRAQGGGIVLFLCTNLGNAPVGSSAPACPPAPATVTGTLTVADIAVATSTPHGIVAGEFDEVIDAIQAEVTYANVHTSNFPGGEIWGQIDEHNHH